MGSPVVVLSRPARPRIPLVPTIAILLLVTGAGASAGPSSGNGGSGPTPITSRGAESAPSLPVFIGPSNRVVDPDVPLTLEAETSGGLPPFEIVWQSPQWGVNHSANWTVILPPNGTATVTLEVADAASEWGAANATFVAGSSPALSLSLPSGPWDQGATLPLNVTIAGGVPPYRLAWRIPGDGASGTLPVEAPGSVVLLLDANATLPQWVDANLSDAVGGVAEGALLLGPVSPLPRIEATTVPGMAEAGQPVSLQGVVEGGAPPITWTVTPIGAVSQPSTASGTVASSAPFVWSAIPTAPGNLTLLVTAVDASGQSASAALPLPVLIPVSSSLVATPPTVANGSPLLLAGEVSGGLPPYRYQLTVGKNVSAAGNLSSASPMNWTLVVVPAHPVDATLRVWDALGYSTNSTLVVPVLPAAPPTTPGPGAGPGGGILVAGGAALALAGVGTIAGLRWWSRTAHRRSHRPADPSDPLAPLERLLGPADGLDSETLEELAGDQEGLDSEQLTRLLDQGMRAGRVRRHSGPEGESYRWVRAPPSSLPEPEIPLPADPLPEDP